MTNQEIFDTVLAHCRKQRVASTTRTKWVSSCATKWVSSCAYRGENDTRCAVGCLIPDEFYSSDIEGLRVSCELSDKGTDNERTLVNVLYASGVQHSQFDLLGSLQDAHDFYMPEAENLGQFYAFEQRMSKIAYKEGLVYTKSTQKQSGEHNGDS